MSRVTVLLCQVQCCGSGDDSSSQALWGCRMNCKPPQLGPCLGSCWQQILYQKWLPHRFQLAKTTKPLAASFSNPSIVKLELLACPLILEVLDQSQVRLPEKPGPGTAHPAPKTRVHPFSRSDIPLPDRSQKESHRPGCSSC